MAILAEAMGMSLPGSSTIPAVDARRRVVAEASGQALMKLLEAGIRPRDVMTYDAFRNAIAVDAAMGGSTNAVLHLLAIANEAGVKLTLDDFDEVYSKTPYIADLLPGGGRYAVWQLDRIGGLPLVLRKLGRRGGLVNLDALTVTGESMGKNLDKTWPWSLPLIDRGDIIKDLDNPPILSTGGVAILRGGNLAPEGGAVVKVAGVKKLRHEGGPARVFNDEESAFNAVTQAR